MAVCHVLQPAQHQLSSGHLVSCHLVDPAGIPELNEKVRP